MTGQTRPGVIERALALAPECNSVAEITRKLKAEGYDQVDHHLVGRTLRRQLVERLMPSHKKRRVR